MAKRFVSIFFTHLRVNWFTRRKPELQHIPFVLASAEHGRMLVTAANTLAQAQGIDIGMAVADARAILPGLLVLDDETDLAEKLLTRIAAWCIRFTPVVAIDLPDGLILDATGCTHLWGGDKTYLCEISKRLEERGYNVRIAISDTIGASWAIARFGQRSFLIGDGLHIDALMSLPPASLRLETGTIERMHKLGLRQIKDFIRMPRATLLRRFGDHFIQRLNQALGQATEIIQPVQPIIPYQERLPCLEPIVTATGIEIALNRLLESLCNRLKQEEKGLRMAIFKGYRVDGKIEEVAIGTHRPSHHVSHLFKLFEIKLSTIEPELGIELFILEAPKVEDHKPLQDKLWNAAGGLEDIRLSELIDRLEGKIGTGHIHRYIPDEHYWPERSIKMAASLLEQPASTWKTNRPRPVQLLPKPEPIEVTAPIPDYPPMLFRYKGKLHTIKKADGPERIEQEWWLQQGQHRDYYYVEDEQGQRYWLFRLGHYDTAKSYQWFIHGFFA